MQKIKLKENRKKRGFTLFIAMIVTTLILGIGFSIGNIILKELNLTATGKRSQIAFYAADSIAECALYWDRKDVDGYSVLNSNIITVTDSPFATSTVGPFIQCGTGVGIPDTQPGRIAGFTKAADDLNATSSFFASFSDPNNPSIVACGQVTVIKRGFSTTIKAKGYNVGYSTSANGCDTSNLKTAERGIRIDY